MKKFKWIVVLILTLSVLFFFLPYMRHMGDSYNPIQILQDEHVAGRANITAEVILGYIIPVALTFLSALIMVFKIGIGKCIACIVLNVISAGFYWLFIMATFLPVNEIGFVGNVIITHLGIILPIVCIVLIRKHKKREGYKE